MSQPAETILLLHGQPGSARDWDRVSAAIAPRATTLAFDRPGWDGRRGAVGVAGNAAAAVEELDRAGIDRATVVGHSFGGAVAAWLAAFHPERVSRLVLVAPAANLASLGRVDYLLAIPVAGYLLGAAALGGAGAALRARPIRQRIGSRLSLEERFLRAAGDVLLAPDAWLAFFLEQRALVDELPTLEARLGRIAAPTTILAGTNDPIVPVSAARRLASQISGAEFVLLPGAGHLLAQQRASELAEAIAGRVPLG